MAKPTPCSRRLLAFILVFVWATSLKAPAATAQNYPNCNGSTSLIRDAICDIALNNEDCGYDGGDCCECTCIDTNTTSCGSGAGFFCTDPDVPLDCFTTTSPTPSPTPAPEVDPYADCEGYLPHLQDGYCDSDLNVADCGWDGGDCCICTCIKGLTHECGEIGDGFDCKDPDAPTDCDEALLSDCTGSLYYYQDGYCDDDLNNAECGWDGGDCCRCTCRDYTYNYDDDWWGYYDYNLCGVYGYDCLDPDAPTDCDTEAPTPSPAQNTPYPDCDGYISWIGDGYCDSSLNIEECDWDGGDCCEDGNCSICYDPDAECVEATPSPTPTLYSNCPQAYLVGDGDCDSTVNTEECEWDGGDCCPCTCLGTYYDCTDFDCIDPSADCSSSTYGDDDYLDDTSANYGDDYNDDQADDDQADDDQADDDGSTRNQDTSTNTADTSGFSDIAIIGLFAMGVLVFFCSGGCIFGVVYLFFRKSAGGGAASARHPTGARPQPLPPTSVPGVFVPPNPSGGHAVGSAYSEVKESER